MKKMISFALALIMVLVLVACGDNPASNGGNTQNETVTLRASTPTAPEHPWSKCLDNIAAQIKEKTNGRYQIDVYYNASLSENSEKTMTEQIMTGTLDLGISPAPLVGKAFSAFSFPFQFDDRDHIKRVCDSDTAKELLAATESNGLHSMAYVENGFRQITNNKHAVKTPDDMKGLKIRTPQAATTMAAITAMGANATAINAGELYVALSQDTVDGQENALSTIYNNGYYEVQKYCTVINYNWSPAIVIFNSELWDTLSADDQKIFEEVVAAAAEECNEQMAADDESYIAKLTEKGMEVYTLTPEERNAFKILCNTDAVKEAYNNSVGADIMEKFAATVEACR